MTKNAVQGKPITFSTDQKACVVPEHPIIPFIEGDGTGPDIWRAAVRVLDGAECPVPYHRLQ